MAIHVCPVWASVRLPGHVSPFWRKCIDGPRSCFEEGIETADLSRGSTRAQTTPRTTAVRKAERTR